MAQKEITIQQYHNPNPKSMNILPQIRHMQIIVITSCIQAFTVPSVVSAITTNLLPKYRLPGMARQLN